MGEYVQKFEKQNCSPPVEPLAVIRNMRIRPINRPREVEIVKQAVLDTGADYSTLPHREFAYLLKDLNVPKSPCEITTPDGTRVPVTRVKLQYMIPRAMQTWGAVYFLIWGQEFLVGRDILSQFVFQFDGPNQILRLRG